MGKIKCEKNLQNEDAHLLGFHTVIIAVGAHFMTGHSGSSKLIN